MQCRLGRGLPPCQVSSWSIQPFDHNAPITDRQDRQTDNGPIARGEPFYKRSPKNVISSELADTTYACLFVDIIVVFVVSVGFYKYRSGSQGVVAQRVGRRTYDQKVAGSTPDRPAA